MLEIVKLFFISILPIILILSYIIFNDREREPFHFLAILFFSGIASVLLTFIMSISLRWFFPFFDSDFRLLNPFKLIIYSFLGVAIIEEISKWLMLSIISYHSKHFDEFYDMIVYSCCVSLGFACVENILYVFSSGFKEGIIRMFTAVPGHASFAIFMGYYLGLAKIASINNRKDLERKYFLFSITIPTILHGLYDYSIMINNIYFIIFYFVFIVALYILANKKVIVVSAIKSKMAD